MCFFSFRLSFIFGCIVILVTANEQKCEGTKDCTYIYQFLNQSMLTFSILRTGIFGGCLCFAETCINPLKLEEQKGKCSPCTLASGCTVPDFCLPGFKICNACFKNIKEEITASCFKNENETQTIPGTNIAWPCISTQWLVERGLQGAVLRNSGTSNQNVLCIPDDNGNIPCGTPGHLLREANTGKLISYQTVCDERKDCIRSAMPVSQLSHDYDWSFYRTGKFELTSLSAHPDSKSNDYAPSRILAALADMLNTAGLGRLCDSFVLLSHKIRDAKLHSGTTASTFIE